MCICFSSKHPILIIWKSRKRTGLCSCFLRSGYKYMSAGKGIALSKLTRFAIHFPCVCVCVPGSLECSTSLLNTDMGTAAATSMSLGQEKPPGCVSPPDSALVGLK